MTSATPLAAHNMDLLVVVGALAWQPALLGPHGASRMPAGMSSETPLRYDGALMGVKASILLYKRNEQAVINLRGVPLGGTIRGTAWFAKDGFKVKLDDKLTRALGWRGVAIEGAGAFHDYSKVWVLIKLPLGLGRHTMSLDRTYS